MRCAIGLLLLLILGSQTDAQSSSLFSETRLTVYANRTEYRLNDRFLFSGSDTVRLNDSVLNRSGYSLDYNRGVVVLKFVPPDSAVLRVTYRRLPYPELQQVYYRRTLQPESLAPPSPESIARAIPPETAASEGQLALNGAKTVTVSLGNGGLDLDQSLHLDLRGTIAGVNLTAVLSDQGTGIPAEGTSRDLNELDRVLISLSNRNLRGSFGDFDYRQPQGELDVISRRLRGAEVVWHPVSDSVLALGPELGAGYAQPKGRFAHNAFNGADGKQGPYVLAGDMQGIVIVPGSEKVYLNSRQLQRGWDADYTVDYELGELTFTNRNQLSGQSRVEVDFEYTTDEYQRSIVIGRVGYGSNPVRVSFGSFVEGDDRDSHIAGAFTSAETESLAQARDDTSLAWLGGVDSVGFGQGDYVREGDHFRFAGRDSGNFKALFSQVADSTGDYVYDYVTAAFRFVGSGMGNYVARRQVRLPERAEAYSIDAAVRPLPGIDVNLTGIWSRYSRNLFAATGPKNGLGYDAGLNWQTRSAGVSYARRELGHNLQLPGQVKDRDLAYTWGLAIMPDEYARDELVGFVAPLRPLKLDLGLGWLRTPSTASARVDRKRGTLGAHAWWAEYRLELVGPQTRHRVDLAPHFGPILPAVAGRVETDSAQRLIELIPSLGFRTGDKTDARLSWQRTELGTRDSTGRAFRRDNLLNVYRADLVLSAFTNLDLNGVVGYQNQDYVTSPASDFSQLFVDLTANYTIPAGFRSRINLDQKYKSEALKQEIFTPVTPGKGHFSRNPETGEYYPDTLGSFDRQYALTGGRVPARETSLDLSASWFSWRSLSLDLSGQLSQEVTDTATLVNHWSAGASLQVLPYEKVFSFTVADNISSDFDRLTSYLAQHELDNKLRLAASTAANDLVTGTVNLEVPLLRQTTETGQLKRNEFGGTIMLEPVVGSGLDLELTLGYGFKRIQLPLDYPSLGEFELRTLIAGVRRRFNLWQKLVLTAELKADRRTSTVDQLPYEIALTDPLGWTPAVALNLDRMLGSVLVLSGSYSYTKRQDRAAEHNTSLSMKAYF